MNKSTLLLTTLAALSALPATAKDIHAAPPIAPPPAEDSPLKFNAGADLRLRQEIGHNIPGLPGEPTAMLNAPRRRDLNQIRVRPRVWSQLDYGEFTLFARIANEIREYPSEQITKKRNRAYNFPDDVFLDNLYLQGIGLADGFLDFRIGRQDLFRAGKSTVNLNRLFLDGSAYDGSRSAFADMAHFTIHPTETAQIDAFALYMNGRNQLRWGNRASCNRPLTAIHPRDSHERDEWGGGLVWSHTAALPVPTPYQLYALHKHNEAYTAFGGRRIEDKQITALGVHLEPQLTENLSLDLEGAKQFGQASNHTQAGGWMAYAGIDLHKANSAPDAFRPFARISTYYLSGDKHFTGAHDNDTSWDPMWARAPMDSEMMQYGTIYGLGYWSNLLCHRLTIGADFGKAHSLIAYTAALYAPVRDGMGTADGSGGAFRGVLHCIRYNFPIRLAPKNATGLERFSAFGHVLAEFFNPGSYYDTSRPAYFLRWELNFSF